MIEINLVPDVKQELIRAERVRSVVISMTILVGIIAVGVVVLLSVWVFGVQTARGVISDNTIKTESAKLSSVEDLESTLTIQNQLSVLPGLHESKQIDSRIFDILSKISPAAPNQVSINKLAINSTDRTITIEAQTEGGYPALEVFKKTIAATELQFMDGGQQQSRMLAVSMSDGERSYGENTEGKQVLRFSLTFEYPEELFMPYLENASINGPNGKIDVTDSHLGIPKSLFSPSASDAEEGDS